MDKILRRGDVVMAPFGREEYMPVIVLSEGIYNQKSGTIIAVPAMRGKPAAGYPLSYKLTKKIEGHDYWVKPGQIKSFSSLSLGYVIDFVEAHELKEIIAALSEIISEPII